MSQFLTHPVPAVVILLGLLVFFHELGHFVVGRLCGIAVETFSIGFGPRIFSFTHRGTEYRLSWIPLGGYVRFGGANPHEDLPPGLPGTAFLKTPLVKRAAAVFAGPVANFLLAICVYTVLGFSGMPHPPALIGEVIDGSPAATAGILSGDRLVRIDEHEIKTWRDLEEVISTSPGKKLTITVERRGQLKTLSLTPDTVTTPDMTGKQVKIGRAGIALGRAPAIVTVLSQTGVAAATGLATGDRITQVQWAGQSERLAVSSYPQLVDTLRDAMAAGAETVTLVAELAPLPELERGDKAGTAAVEPPKKSPVRLLTLPLAAAKGLPAGATDRELMRALGLTDAELTIAEATDGASPLLRQGDLLLAWNGVPVRDVFGLREALIANTAPEATLRILRDFAPVDVRLPLKGIDAQRPDGMVTVYTLPVLFWGQPVEPPPLIETYANPAAALGFGIRQTAAETKELVNNVASLVTGDIPLKALGGPMLIAKVAGDSARRGWQTFLGSMALISINLGLLNLFPIPVLDGGQLMLMGAEAVRRRPLREAAVENFQKVGFAMVMALVVLATYNDLSRFWKSMLESVVGLFQ